MPGARVIFVFVFVASGVAALVYQTIWQRMLTLFGGADVFSVTIVVAAFMVGIDDEILVIASGGIVIRMPVREISSQGRDATGVRVMNLEDEQRVAAVAPVLGGD